MSGIRSALFSHTLRTSQKRNNIKQLLIAVLGRPNSRLLPSWAEREETTIPEDSSLLNNKVHSSSIFPFRQWKVGVLWYCTSNNGCFLPPTKSTDIQHLIYDLGIPHHLTSLSMCGLWNSKCHYNHHMQVSNLGILFFFSIELWSQHSCICWFSLKSLGDGVFFVSLQNFKGTYEVVNSKGLGSKV